MKTGLPHYSVTLSENLCLTCDNAALLAAFDPEALRGPIRIEIELDRFGALANESDGDASARDAGLELRRCLERLFQEPDGSDEIGLGEELRLPRLREDAPAAWGLGDHASENIARTAPRPAKDDVARPVASLNGHAVADSRHASERSTAANGGKS